MEGHVKTNIQAKRLSIRKNFKSKWILLIVPIIYLTTLLYLPIINIIKLAFVDENGLTFEYIIKVLSNATYLKILTGTFKIAITTTIFCVLIGYPVAYYATVSKSQKIKNTIISVVIVTLWISLLIRTFSWTVILQNDGVINSALMSVGLIEEPIKLVYNFTGVIIGMVHVLIPYMILSIYSIMTGIDHNLMQAAQGLGANKRKAFFQIFLPLSLPGVIAGSIIVFIMSLGFYITPALLGGDDSIMISNLIERNVNTTLNWNIASSLTVVLLGATLLFLIIVVILSKSVSILKGSGK